MGTVQNCISEYTENTLCGVELDDYCTISRRNYIMEKLHGVLPLNNSSKVRVLHHLIVAMSLRQLGQKEITNLGDEEQAFLSNILHVRAALHDGFNLGQGEQNVLGPEGGAAHHRSV